MINVSRYLTQAQAQKCVAESDADFDVQLESIYDDLLISHGRFHGQAVKAIALCGPTCAGKTTTAKKLTSMLESHGKRVHVLSIDDLEIGMVMQGTVRNIVDFGAFVDIGVHQDGLVHISQLVEDRFVKHPLDIVSVGDIVDVKVLDVDSKRNRINLSMKV